MRKLPIAVLIALAVGVVIGYVLGGVAPRRDLQEAEQEVEQLEEALAEADPGSGLRSPVPGLDQILRAPPELRPQGEEYDEQRREERAAARSRGDAGPGGRWGAFRNRGEGGEDPLAAFQRAASVQRVRNVQSRAALEQQAGLDDEELAEVDAAVAEMNEALVGYGEELIMMALEGERPPARDLLGITHDVTGILQRAQLRLEEVVGTDRAEDVDPSALEVWNHIDLELLEPAARTAVERSR